jgi:AGZA family xanthine/uracil permease-like MFS transporter
LLQAGNFELLGPQCLANTNDPGAQACMMQLTRSLITATAASSLISTFFIGFFGNLPLALAPGIGQ